MKDKQLPRGTILFEPGRGFVVAGCRCKIFNFVHRTEAAAQTCSRRTRFRGGYSGWKQPLQLVRP